MGTWCDQPGDVLIMSAEDGVADTIRPRLDAAGADVARVHVIEHGLSPSGQPVALTLGSTDEIERHITETKARLLIIDVLMAYMPGDAYRDQHVRKTLTPLAMVAERTGCAVLLLRHPTKTKRGEAIFLLAETVVLREPTPGIVNYPQISAQGRGFRPATVNQFARMGARSAPFTGVDATNTIRVSAGRFAYSSQQTFCSGFDSRQLHSEPAGQRPSGHAILRPKASGSQPK
jgi:hypothetical protein